MLNKLLLKLQNQALALIIISVAAVVLLFIASGDLVWLLHPGWWGL